MKKKSKSKKIKVIATLGNICSGKSFAVKIFKEYGFFTFSADEIVKKEYLNEKSNFRNEIIKLFKNEDINIFSKEKIDKLKILENIIVNEDLYLKMNKITKNFIVPKIYEIINNFKKNRSYRKSFCKNKCLLIFEITLFFEMELDQKYFDKILIIKANNSILESRFLENRKSHKKFFDFFIKNQTDFDFIEENKKITKISNNLSKNSFLKKIKNYIFRLKN